MSPESPPEAILDTANPLLDKVLEEWGDEDVSRELKSGETVTATISEALEMCTDNLKGLLAAQLLGVRDKRSVQITVALFFDRLDLVS